MHLDRTGKAIISSVVLTLLLCSFFSFPSNNQKDAPTQDRYEFKDGKMNKPFVLNTGWNLISIPFILDNNSVKKVFESINKTHYVVEYYDAYNTSDRWRSYSQDKPDSLNDLYSVDNTMGVWLYLKNATNATLVITGSIPDTTFINLRTGWNLIGYPSIKNRTVSQVFQNLTDLSYEVQCFDKGSPYSLRNMGQNEVFHMGLGYWVYVSVDCVLRIDWR